MRPDRRGANNPNFRNGGVKRFPEYGIWQAMKYRCLNPSCKNYRYYGGIGITVCPEWRSDFFAFYKALGPRPTAKHTIERIDTCRGYEPGNCRWATWAEQANNKRRTHYIELHGTRLTIARWAELTGIPHDTIFSRMKDGCPPEIILNPKKWVRRKQASQ